MDYDFGPQADALRVRLRTLIDEHFPHDFLGAFTDDPADFALTQAFCKTLAAEGLLTMAWPAEYGGNGASLWEQTVVREEMWAAHEPRGAQYMGLNWVGPALMKHGTPEQRAQHLTPIAAGDVIWCQGFSEPEAGTDLASLRTRANETPDGWTISGQKVWTSYASMAGWCVLAACTDPAARPSQRITLFLLPMDRAGILVRPIASMLGPHHLNEMFFEDVVVGPEDVLGTVGGGWQVMRDALAYERVGIARYARCDALLAALGTELADGWDELPGALRSRWVRALLDVRVARLLAYRAVGNMDENGEPTPGAVDHASGSTARIATTMCDQSVAEVLTEAAGIRALDRGTDAVLHGAIDDHWRYAQAATVSSGTIEVQRMLVAKSVLGGSAT